ncbi:sugar transferase [Bacillus thuringiensis]|uniref:Multidrug MFS transporter n=1 Tax=Bacillus thuringiensis serovar toumanoffi TaxID=180862 RepID=A0ABD5I7Z3_BACTU|nr:MULTISPECIES: sugar transferase [Bacillus cereus group]OUA63807.1 multidrug MFS transporter [Bacillus thuringiensis serovar thailandensis]HDR7524100.1 sugar transferase [Bacillus paranthracis]EEL62339.1 Exopolysaccharide biosynthesis protein [Bacillus cereus F65185]EEM93323.1 Exopolysaccharide biosynthesis protein [Bacillus thuringiensis IBL 200]MBE5096318.1 sugar transferase [Bacillus thuringiensis]
MNKNSVIEESFVEDLKQPSRPYLFSKRAVDIFGAIVGLIVFSPIFIIMPFAYMRGGAKGPVFFKQMRIGKNGNKFYIRKFRSMVVDAEGKLKANEVLYKKYIENNYKLEPDEDPRITKIGRFLRETSLDELPQLINVLKGEMSLVGPRPVVEEELREYGNKVSHLLAVKPGVTGYWQVSGRSDVGYPERVDLELHYVYNQSIGLDLGIILKTIYLVLSRKGAY